MLKYHNYDIVFQEVPGEVTLAINITNCPNGCKGCHSPYLMKDEGAILNEEALCGLLENYGQSITCICFMGGDAAPQEVKDLAFFVQRITHQRVKTAWYSGKQHLPELFDVTCFNFIKLGPYVEQLGGLTQSTTNQRFYRVEGTQLIDETHLFFKS